MSKTSTYAPGDFSFWDSEWDEKMYKNAYDAVTTENLWDFLKNASPPEDKGFMFWDAPELGRIYKHMEVMGHSGCSHAITMRTIEYIAKHGWDKYVADTIAAIEQRKKEDEAKKTEAQRRIEEDRARERQWIAEQNQRERQQVINWFTKKGLPVPKEVLESTC